MTTPLEAARFYTTRRRIRVVPVPFRRKGPILEEWQRLRLTEADLPRYFNEGRENLGALLGEASDNLVDSDLDCDEAVAVALTFLPPTSSWSGRQTRPRSHAFHRTRTAIETEKHHDPVRLAAEDSVDPAADPEHRKAMLIELRSTGAQTLLPPSVHPENDPYQWDEDGEPTLVDGSVLQTAVRRIAACAALIRYWPAEGVRHELVLALSGMFAHGGLDSTVAETLIETVTRQVKGREGAPPKAIKDAVKLHLGAVQDTYARVKVGKKVRGIPKLLERKLFPHADVLIPALQAWLGLRTTAVPVGAAWPTPQPVPTELPTVAPFDVATLMPGSFAPWVSDVAERLQCPPDYVGVTVMVTAGSVIGRQVVVRPKRFDDWEVVPNLWGLVVGPPGIMKSPAIKEGTRPLRRLIAAEMERYKVAMHDARFIRMKRDAQEERLKRALKEALEKAKGDEQAPDVLKVRDQLREPGEALPKERIYRTNDATTEKIAVLLNDNPNGFLVERDEIAGLIKTMDREGHQNDRAFYEECWNGTGSYRVDRIERGTLYVEAACLSLLGGIQPVPLEAYLREWERRGLDDGFIARFQLLVYFDVTPFHRVDRWPESAARDTAVEAFRLIDRLDLQHVHAHTDAGVLPWLHFDAAAQATFDVWYDGWQRTLRTPT